MLNHPCFCLQSSCSFMVPTWHSRFPPQNLCLYWRIRGYCSSSGLHMPFRCWAFLQLPFSPGSQKELSCTQLTVSPLFKSVNVSLCQHIKDPALLSSIQSPWWRAPIDRCGFLHMHLPKHVLSCFIWPTAIQSSGFSLTCLEAFPKLQGWVRTLSLLLLPH